MPPSMREGHAALLAPMPGRVVAVRAAAGASVAAHATVVVIEAMKMEHAVDDADRRRGRQPGGARGRPGAARGPAGRGGGERRPRIGRRDRRRRPHLRSRPARRPAGRADRSWRPRTSSASSAMLADAGLREIETTSLVSPKAIPQLADAEEVLQRARPASRRALPGAGAEPARPGARRGGGRRRHLPDDRGHRFYVRHNIGMSQEESLAAFEPIAAEARASAAGGSAAT